MNAALLALVVGTVSPYQRVDPPALTIRAVIPRRDASSDVGCSVRLANMHTRAATAWVLETVPSRTEGGSYDRAASRGLWLRPTEETTVTYPCSVGEVPALDVVAVLYDDNGVAGDRDKLSTHVIAARLKLASGLRELRERLHNRPAAEGTEGNTREHLLTFIEGTADPRITSRVKEEAKTVLRNLGAVTKAPSGSPSSMVAALHAELQKAIEALEVVPLQAVAR